MLTSMTFCRTEKHGLSGLPKSGKLILWSSPPPSILKLNGDRGIGRREKNRSRLDWSSSL